IELNRFHQFSGAVADDQNTPRMRRVAQRDHSLINERIAWPATVRAAINPMTEHIVLSISEHNSLQTLRKERGRTRNSGMKRSIKVLSRGSQNKSHGKCHYRSPSKISERFWVRRPPASHQDI